MTRSLIAQAEELADYLNRNRLDGDRLNALAILDALASLGMELVPDRGDHSSAAYYLAVRDALQADGQTPHEAGEQGLHD